MTMASTARAAGRTTGTAAGRWARRALLLATLVGLVVMHQLAGTAAPGGHRHHPAAAAPAAGSGEPHPHSHGDRPHGDGPEHTHGHPGQVCQPQQPSTVVAPAPGLIVLPYAAPAYAVPLSADTAASEAAAGSGCGPPSLTELSISRT